jgi:HlyD family secretion protein
LPRPPRDASPKRASTSAAGAQQVWVLRNGEPTPIPVTVGATDGRLTEVTGGELQPGMHVVTDSLGSPQ